MARGAGAGLAGLVVPCVGPILAPFAASTSWTHGPMAPKALLCPHAHLSRLHFRTPSRFLTPISPVVPISELTSSLSSGEILAPRGASHIPGPQSLCSLHFPGTFHLRAGCILISPDQKLQEGLSCRLLPPTSCLPLSQRLPCGWALTATAAGNTHLALLCPGSVLSPFRFTSICLRDGP